MIFFAKELNKSTILKYVMKRSDDASENSQSMPLCH